MSEMRAAGEYGSNFIAINTDKRANRDEPT
jgi:hypothetical protein